MASERTDSGVALAPRLDSFFPEEAASRLSQLESFNKHLYRPNSYLHKWWARRSGTATRFVLKQLANPESADFYSPGGLEGVRILDPMIGGGTTVHEAIRLGANVAGIDLDPIPVLQTRASLEKRPLEQKEAAFEVFLAKARREFEQFFITTCPVCKNGSELRFMLYGSRRECDCGESIVVDSLILRQSPTQTIRICGECHEVYSDGVHTVHEPRELKIMSRDVDRCPRCRQHYRFLRGIPLEQRYTPIAVVGICRRDGQFFRRPDQRDLSMIEEARKRASRLQFSSDFAIRPGPKSDDLIRLKVKTYAELYSPRQLLFLDWSIRYLPETGEDRLWLGLLVSTSLEFNSMLCGYKGADIRRPGAIRHVFAYHAYSIPYTALENNPVQKNQSSGTLTQLFNGRVARASTWAEQPVEVRLGPDIQRVAIPSESDRAGFASDWKGLESGTQQLLLLQGDAARVKLPEHFFDYVVTDPPYYDNVQYSDLSAFFRVWLNRLLPNEADWMYDNDSSAVNTGQTGSKERYRVLMAKIWKNCADSLRPGGRLVFTFHHWKPEAWTELALSLRDAGFRLVNRYVVFSENPTSVHIKNLKSLRHDAILVLRLRAESKKKWTKPPGLDSDSYRFVQSCGTMLGWTLESPESESTVRRTWEALIPKHASRQ